MPVRAKKKQLFIFGSFLLCSLSSSLLAASFATDHWFESDSTTIAQQPLTYKGYVYFGLFTGMNVFTSPPRIHPLYVVCLEDSCMYSCASSKETRDEQLQMLLDGETEGLKEHCTRDTENARQPLMMVDSIPAQIKRDGVASRQIDLLHSSVSLESTLVLSHYGDSEQTGGYGRQRPDLLDDNPSTESTQVPSETDELEFMDYGLWVGTITCLSAGLLMAVVGALFAVVNTATTPVEAITGVPGLYLWNGLAVLFDMLTVILWAVQFHKHLSSNVLLYDSSDGWTTEGLQEFGYSFWLVVVAIFVHVANIAIIAIGTYEPKKKTQLEAPESKGGNIMLY